MCHPCRFPVRPQRFCGCGAKIGRQNKTGRCRSCSWQNITAAPGFEQRRLDGLAIANADPQLKALHAAHISSFSRRPEERKRKSEMARRIMHRTVLSPQCRARAHSPETVAKRTRARVERILGWCPPEYRDHYRHLNQRKKFPAATARAMTLEKIEADRNKLSPFERQLDAIRRGAGIIEIHPIRRAEPMRSLVGCGTAECGL
jgi:hypothetical protein